MIDALRLENFKAFRSAEFGFRQLTVLTGLNSTGKSTVMQALILTQVAVELGGELVPLNGPYGLALGEALDVLNSSAELQTITFALSGPLGMELVILGVPNDRAVALQVVQLEQPAGMNPLRDGHIETYLSAERLGPRDLLEIAPGSDSRIVVGHQGQFTAHALALSERTIIRESLLHPSTAEAGLAITLEAQAQEWLSTIVRPVLVEARWLAGANAATLRFRDPDLLAEWSRPANVGFGLSYALPVIVAALTASPGTMFLVENPEAHLHPAGQSLMGQFLTRVAAAGVQVVIETHSDHVINGVRLAVARDGLLAPDDALIHFLGDAGMHHNIQIQGSGALTEWPPGFFDQSELDLSQLARIRRRV
jgi:predicted ATPase